MTESVLGDWRGRFPFSIGAPSWVLPLEVDNFVGNISFLATKVDKVQILCFGADHVDELLNPVDIDRLLGLRRETGLRYSVHLPSDLAILDPGLASGGQRWKIDLIARIIKLTEGLEPDNYILHLDEPAAGASDTGPADYQRGDRVAACLSTLVQRLPEVHQRIHLENTSWDLVSAARELTVSGYGLCADFGHLFHRGHSIPAFLENFGSLIREIHLHGFNPGGDHLPLSALDRTNAALLCQFLRNFQGSVVIENFRADWLEESLRCLDGWINHRSP